MEVRAATLERTYLVNVVYEPRMRQRFCVPICGAAVEAILIAMACTYLTTAAKLGGQLDLWSELAFGGHFWMKR